MKYLNKNTGIMFESNCLISGECWEPVVEPTPEPAPKTITAEPKVEEKKEKKTAKGGKKK